MKNLYCTLTLFFISMIAFSQEVKLQIITKQNDTIKDYGISKSYSNSNTMVYELEGKLVVYNDNGDKKEFNPSEIKSFSFINNDKLVEFINIEDKVLGLIMYSNKLKLVKVIKHAYTPVNIYIILRPNNGKTSYMEAMGLSRLISKKVITREITDCPSVIEKVENSELRINGEEGVLEMVKYYESTCF
jgi:hypothetical protein